MNKVSLNPRYSNLIPLSIKTSLLFISSGLNSSGVTNDISHSKPLWRNLSWRMTTTSVRFAVLSDGLQHGTFRLSNDLHGKFLATLSLPSRLRTWILMCPSFFTLLHHIEIQAGQDYPKPLDYGTWRIWSCAKHRHGFSACQTKCDENIFTYVYSCFSFNGQALIKKKTKMSRIKLLSQLLLFSMSNAFLI